MVPSLGRRYVPKVNDVCQRTGTALSGPQTPFDPIFPYAE